jgi:hypothetical protein
MSEETKQAPNLVDMLKEFPGAPDSEKIDSWKQKHGEVFCSAFSDTEVFIWRSLTRKEYVDIQKTPREQPLSELEVQDLVVNLCLLWSSNEKILELKGGSISTLSEQIMMNSNFLAPQVAASFVIRL